MSDQDTEGNNVLPFKRVVKRVAPSTTAAAELTDLLIVYDHLISLLRETYDDGLDSLTDGIVASVVRCREALTNHADEQACQQMVKEMSEGLRQLPRNLRSLLPGIGARLGESLERKLGIQFCKY